MAACLSFGVTSMRTTRLRIYFPAVVVLVLALLGTVIGADLLHSERQAVERHNFHDYATEIRDAIGNAMTAYERVLPAGAALFHTPPMLPRDGWRDFVRTLRLNKNLPGLREAGYVRYQYREETSRRSEERRHDVSGNGPSSAGSLHTISKILLCLETEDWRNLRALGFEIASSMHQPVMDHALNTGEPSLSSTVALVHPTGSDAHVRLLLFVPVYDSAVLPATAEERRTKLSGFIYGAFFLRDFIDAALLKQKSRWSDTVRMEIFEGRTASGNPLFDSGALGTHTPKFSEILPLDIGQRHWSVRVSSMTAIEPVTDRALPRTILAGGLAISLLIAAIVASLAYAHERTSEARGQLSQEIKEKERARRDAELANRELIHRVKNTLAVVTAIASQTARYSTTLDGFSQAFRDRLSALGRVHDLLRPDPAHSPDFGAFIRYILAPYCVDHAADLSVEGPAVQIPNNEAVLLSLLINELATNATKYGAWSVPGGRVEVTWQIEPENSAQYFTVLWREHGGAPVAAPSKAGFGTNLMKFSIERGLGGSITSTFEGDGVKYAIRFPRRPMGDGNASPDRQKT